MNKPLAAAMVWMMMCGGAFAANNAPASDASIRQMLELTNAQQMLASMKGQMTALMNTAMQNATKGQTITPERQAVLDRMAANISSVVTDMLNWDDLLPMYLRTYRAAFTQDEIDGVIKFYKSPAGKAYVNKLPAVMQNLMGEMQGFMRTVQEKIQAVQKESLQELKDLKDKEDAKK
ncbi:MAG TPA: DUF2059 domain-containing protein [Steroidobacteraceae bacterium]|jgi:hypothetical protein|nr:DUF2059 domain-containing protein [Steroidobacteraceae bacterium]